MQARIAQIKDFEKINAIWTECFQLEGGYLSLLHKYILKTSQVFLLLYSSQILSVFSLVPISFLRNNTVLNGAYLAYVATPEKHRGNGYFHKLFNLVFEQNFYEKEGCGYDFLLVRPAEKSLENIYFREGFSVKVFKPCCNAKDSTGIQSWTHLQILEKLKALEPVFIWNGGVFEFSLAEYQFNPATKKQMDILMCTDKEEIRRSIKNSNEAFAYIKILKNGISASIFEDAAFFFTLE